MRKPLSSMNPIYYFISSELIQKNNALFKYTPQDFLDTAQ